LRRGGSDAAPQARNQVDATKSKSHAIETKFLATKTKSVATKTKSDATKTKRRFEPPIMIFQRLRG
jgi:hypothetical protein